MLGDIKDAELPYGVDEDTGIQRLEGKFKNVILVDDSFVKDSIGHFRRALSSKPSVVCSIRSEQVSDTVFEIHGISRKYRFEDYEIDKHLLKLCIFELVIAGLDNTHIAERCNVAASLETPRFKNKYIEHVVDQAIINHDLPFVFEQPVWFTVPVNAMGCVDSTDMRLHYAYFMAGVVEKSTVSCADYDKLCRVMFVGGYDPTLFERSAVSEQRVKVFVHALAADLDVQLSPDLNANDWFAAITDSASLTPALANRRVVLAMVGDAVLKVVLFRVGLNVAATPGTLQMHSSVKYSNAYMSSAFARSSYAGLVTCASNVRVCSQRVGSTFLEAIAAVVFEQAGLEGVEKYMRLFNMQL